VRISDEQRIFIVNHLSTLRDKVDCYLFGSRIDSLKKGGDIDILVICDPELTFEEKSTFKYKFWDIFGEQKLDLVSFTQDSNDPFKYLALLESIEL